MFELNTILTPLDASTSSLAALEMAEYLTGLYGAKLHSAHVVSQIPDYLHQILFPYAALGEDLTEFEDELVGAAQRDLRQWLGEAQVNGTHHPGSVVYGDVVPTLQRVILGLGPDLVVMGAHGAGGSRPRQIGSTSARLLEVWPGPILFVRDRERTRRFERVVVATDLSSGSEAVLEAACGLALRSDRPLDVVTVLSDPRLYDGGRLLRGALRVDPNAILGRGKRNAEQQFKQLMGAVEIPFPDRDRFRQHEVNLTVLFGDPAEEIKAHVSQLDAPLLVVGRSHHSDRESLALGRTAEAIVRRVPAHVLVSPIKAD